MPNPLTIAGGWRKETAEPTKKTDIDSQSVPRKAEPPNGPAEKQDAGDHVTREEAASKGTDSGSAAEQNAADHEEVENDEYTTNKADDLEESVPNAEKTSESDPKSATGGYLDKARGAANTVNNIAKTTNAVNSTLGSLGGGSSSGDQERNDEQPEFDDKEAESAEGGADVAGGQTGAQEIKNAESQAGEEAGTEVEGVESAVDTQETENQAEDAEVPTADADDVADANAEGSEDVADAQADASEAVDQTEDGQGKDESIPEDQQCRQAADEVPVEAAKGDQPAQAAENIDDQAETGQSLADPSDQNEPELSERKEGVAAEGDQQTPEAVDQPDKAAEEAGDRAEAGQAGDDLDSKVDSEASGHKEAVEEGVEKSAEQDDDKVEQVSDTDDKAVDDDAEETKPDLSILKGATVNKGGNLVDADGHLLGRLVEGEVKHLVGKKADAQGQLWDDAGNVIGRAELVPENEREAAKEAPFEHYPDATVEADGSVVSGGQRIGTVVDGDPKRLRGSKVDEDGDILDRSGNTVGRAEPWTEPEPEQEEPAPAVDNSLLAGKRVNKAGNVVDGNGTIFGRIVEGNASTMVGRMCDKDGNVRSESGDVIGRAELVPESEREGSKEGPFAELEGLTVAKNGYVVTPAGDIVGRLTSGDAKTLAGRSVDEDGDVIDKNGNVLGKAERYEEPEVEEEKSPLAGRLVNREGNVVDEHGNILGKLVSGDLLTCAGKEVDNDGDVINSKGNTLGHVALLEEIPKESEEDKKKRETEENDRELAKKLAGCIDQSLDRIRPILKLITDKVDHAERTPKEDLDEEELVRQVKPLIEEGGKILSEINGAIRGLDPDGRIQRNAKHKANTKDASPEEYHLAELIKELTGSVTETIDNAKRKIEEMPLAKKELNPLWGLLTEPLFQIIAAVGLLLNGVLGLVGRLLSGIGLGGLVDNLLGGLGVDKILGSLGLGSAYDALTGKDKKKEKKK